MADVTVNLDETAMAAVLHARTGSVGATIERACIKVQARASRLCPVDTGRLRGSIGYTIGEESGEVVGYVGTNVEYARFVEFGTYKMQAQPFLRPALAAL